MEKQDSWEPITAEEFQKLLREEEDELPQNVREVYEQYRTKNDSAQLIRSDMYGYEQVFVAARSPLGVIYYDDVEEGFDFSPLDDDGRLKHPGAANRSLGEAIEKFLMPAQRRS